MSQESQAAGAQRPNVQPWPFYVFVGSAVSGALLELSAPLAWPAGGAIAFLAAGIVLAAVGLSLFIWAGVTFARHRTTVLPHKAASALVTSGPFAFSRNPIYLADTMFFLAAGLILHSLWLMLAGIAFAVLVTLLGILPEERHLEAKFGQAYRDYKARTRRWI